MTRLESPEGAALGFLIGLSATFVLSWTAGLVASTCGLGYSSWNRLMFVIAGLGMALSAGAATWALVRVWGRGELTLRGLRALGLAVVTGLAGVSILLIELLRD